MQFYLMDNAIDSLKFGMSHYKRFLDNTGDFSLGINEYFSELKFSTVAFHNAIELFTKQMLYDVNELLIFNNIDVTKDKCISDLLYQKYTKNSNASHIDFWLVGKIDTTCKTIDYNRSIEILKSIFRKDLTQENYETLDSLGKKRNCMTHLGYWDDFGWYKVMVTLNDTITLIGSFYKNNIKAADRYFKPEMLDELKHLKECADKATIEQWLASNEHQLVPLYKYLQDFFESQTTSCTFDFDNNSLELKEISFTIDGVFKKLIAKALPRKDALLLIDGDKICWLINVDEVELDTGSDGEIKINENSVRIYCSKQNLRYDADMCFSWEKLNLCNTKWHRLKQFT